MAYRDPQDQPAHAAPARRLLTANGPGPSKTSRPDHGESGRLAAFGLLPSRSGEAAIHQSALRGG